MHTDSQAHAGPELTRAAPPVAALPAAGKRQRRRPSRFRRVMRVFISSPGDLAAERRLVAGVVEKLGKSALLADLFVLQPLLWEDETPPVQGLAAQLAVDHYMAEPSEVELVVVM